MNDQKPDQRPIIQALHKKLALGEWCHSELRNLVKTLVLKENEKHLHPAIVIHARTTLAQLEERERWIAPVVALAKKENDEREKPTGYVDLAPYHAQHRYCPKCGFGDVESTTMGHLVQDLRSFVDTNKARCRRRDCGWDGVVHDLVGVPSESEQQKQTGE